MILGKKHEPCSLCRKSGQNFGNQSCLERPEIDYFMAVLDSVYSDQFVSYEILNNDYTMHHNDLLVQYTKESTRNLMVSCFVQGKDWICTLIFALRTLGLEANRHTHAFSPKLTWSVR